MLLRLTVSNCLSIADQQELSMVATKLRGPTGGLIEVPGLTDATAVPVAFIYGPNAAGKSNFMLAFSFAQWAVLASHRSGDPDGGIPRRPFALDPEIETRPTTIEVDFEIDNTRYTYGFDVNDERFLQEWLYSYPEGKRRKLFEREGDEVDFGGTVRGTKKRLVQFMRPNSSFIATATQNDHKEFSSVVQFFRDADLVRAVAVNSATIETTLDDVDRRTIDFLDKIGTGVVDFQRNTVPVSESQLTLRREFISILNKAASEGDYSFEAPSPENDIEIELGHRGASDQTYFFSLDRESSGTRRLLVILSSIYKALDEGTLLIIDEIDASLHTQVVELIVELFSNRSTNPRGAQLLATVHDTNILSSSILRRDQIWLCEKDFRGATCVFSLSDIKLREADNFELGYLQGRYGAIPFAGSVKRLFGIN